MANIKFEIFTVDRTVIEGMPDDFLTKFGLENNSNCSFCGDEKEELAHLFFLEFISIIKIEELERKTCLGKQHGGESITYAFRASA